MEHVKIFLYILILMVGTWSVFYSWQIYKLHTYSFLQPIVHFIIFYNLVIMIDLTAQYSCINLVGDCLLYRSTVYAKIMGPLSSFFFILMTYSLIRVLINFQGKTISSTVRKWLMAGFSIIAVSYGVRIILALQGKFYRWFPITQSTLLDISIVVVLVYLILLLKHGRKSRDKTLKKIINPFGAFYLFGFTVSILSIKIQDPIRTYVFLIIFLLFNLFPLLWFKKYFLRYKCNVDTNGNGRFALDTICKKHHISRREQEIAELILLGKSNKEIESKLFISPHTVKNHVYSLYQKLGVKSRGQLVHLVLESQKTEFS